MKRLPKGHKAQIMGTRMVQTMYTADQMRKFAQRQWVGLTDEDVMSIAFNFDVSSLSLVAKAIEAKLKEKNT